MGNTVSSLYENLWAKKLNLVVIGLDNAGKTSLLDILVHGHHTETTPTVGLSVKEMRNNGMQIKLYDLGGQDSVRESWSKYAPECNCIIFVVDAGDPKRIELSKQALHDFLSNEDAQNKPLLIAVNKIDLPHRLSKFDVIKGLRVDSMTQNTVSIIEVSTLEEKNVDKVVEWILANS